MLLFKKLNDLIVNKLIEDKSISTQKLHKEVAKEYDISLPNFYKVISNLLDEQILIKRDKKLFLHNRWVMWFIDIAERLKNTYLTEEKNIIELQDWEAMYHKASNVEALDGVRGDRMLQVNRVYGNKEATYVYQAHPYYALWMKNTEMAFFKEAKKLADVYFLTWNSNFLDTYWANLYSEIGIQSIASDTVPFLKDWYCVTVIGDYVFEVLYPKEISDYLKIFFDSIKKLEDLNQELFERVFKMKADFKLTLRRDTNQADNIKKIFKKIFLDK